MLDILQSVEYIYAYMPGKSIYRISLFVICYLLPSACCLLLPLVVTSQDTRTIGQVAEEAKLNNPEIQALRRNVEAKKARLQSEGILDDPVLRIEMMDLEKGSPFPAPGNAGETRYEFSQMFPFPGKLSLEKRIALLRVMTSEAEVRSKEIEIASRLKEAYYEYLLIIQSIKTLEETKAVLSNMVRIAETKYATGEVSQQDVIKAQVELTMLLNEIIDLGAEKDVAEAGMKSILNLPQDVNGYFDHVILSEGKAEIQMDELAGRALGVNPSLAVMKYEADIRELETELTKKNYYPDFMVGIAPVQRDGRFDAWDAMFQMNIPVWRAKYKSQEEEGVKMTEAIRSEIRAEENMIKARVKEGVIKTETAGRIRTLYETSLLPQAELSFESTLKNYQSGKADFIMLLDSERLLKKTKIDYIGAVMTYYKRLVALESVVGEEFN